MRTEQRPHGIVFLAFGVAMLSGSMVALQSRINGALAEQIGSFPAAGFNFCSGLGVLSLLLLWRTFRARLAAIPAAIRGHRLRWFQVLGGVGGALIVSTQVYVVPLVGVAAFLVAMVGGQVVSGLLVDRQGWGPAPPMALSRLRVLAAAIAVAGVAVVASGGSTAGGGLGLATALPVALAFGVGLIGSLQYAFNGRVTAVTRNAFATALVNFFVGLSAVSIIAAIAFGAGAWRVPTTWRAPWWAWTGGVCGIVLITGAAWAVQHTGVLVFGLVAVTTQVSVGVVLDLTNVAVSDRVDAQLITGMVLTVLGSALAAVAVTRSAQRRRHDVVAAG